MLTDREVVEQKYPGAYLYPVEEPNHEVISGRLVACVKTRYAIMREEAGRMFPLCAKQKKASAAWAVAASRIRRLATSSPTQRDAENS